MNRPYLWTLTIILTTISFLSQAKSTEWTGSRSSVWTDAGNWTKGVAVNGDDVSISVAKTYTYAPILAANLSIASLTFGVIAPTTTLTINMGITLTVTGNITAQYSANNVSALIKIQQTISGTTGGTINCNGSFIVGNETAPSDPFALLYVIGYINNTNTVTVNINLQNFTIGQNLTLRSTSSGVANISGYSSVNVNNAVLNLYNGSLNVLGNIETVNKGGHVGYPGFTANLIIIPITTYPAVTPKAQLIVNPLDDVAGNAATLSVGGTMTVLSGDLIDLVGPGPAACTTIYAGNNSSVNQTVYSTSQTGIDASPALYQNLGFSGAGAKTMQSGNITLTGNWTSTGGLINASNSSNIYFQGSGSSPQTLNDNAGVTFNNATFQNANTTKTIATGNFSVWGSGVLTVDSAVTFNAGDKLTLLSTAAGSATVATLRHNAVINGKVNVQRFIKGSSADLSKRGYRLLSSPVFTATVAGVNCFDLNYLLNDAYVSGAAGGGFNLTGNPSLYLYREDISASDAGFTAGNWKGIAKITNTSPYAIGTQQRLTTTNIADTTVNLPVGNGVLFFFRGNKNDTGTQSGTKTIPPFDYPEDVVFTQTGQLNTGTINVTQWYNSPAGFSYTNAANVKNSGIRGFVFVGNPYPSTINFEKFNRNGAKSSIYGQGFPAANAAPGKIWIFNPSNKQYETYMQTTNTVSSSADTTSTINPFGSIALGAVSNMIASGQGFFMRASAPGQGLTFRETAKTNTLASPASLNLLMNAPEANALALTSAAPAVAAAPLFSLLKFNLAKDSVNTDEAVLVFNNKTPATFNNNDDAEDLNGNGALVSLSVISSDNIAAAIKRVKLPQAGSQAMKLLVDATSSGTYHLKLKNLDNMPNAYNIWLIDSLMKDSLDLKHNRNYDFIIDKNNPATFGRNRFSVVVRQNPAAMMHALSFAVNKIIQGAQLNWRTENEGNNFIFSVDKSLDGKTFTQIGQIASNGSGNYAYTDVQPAKGMNYYKIRLQDMVLGTISYSNMLRLNYVDAAATVASGNLSVYPNPATGLVNIKIPIAENGHDSFSISILNSSGRVVKQLTSSSQNLQTDVTQFIPGTYIVQILNLSDNKLQGQTKFVKL